MYPHLVLSLTLALDVITNPAGGKERSAPGGHHLVNQAVFTGLIRTEEAVSLRIQRDLLHRLPGVPGHQFIQPLADLEDFLISEACPCAPPLGW